MNELDREIATYYKKYLFNSIEGKKADDIMIVKMIKNQEWYNDIQLFMSLDRRLSIFRHKLTVHMYDFIHLKGWLQYSNKEMGSWDRYINGMFTR